MLFIIHKQLLNKPKEPGSGEATSIAKGLPVTTNHKISKTKHLNRQELE